MFHNKNGMLYLKSNKHTEELYPNYKGDLKEMSKIKME